MATQDKVSLYRLLNHHNQSMTMKCYRTR